LVGGATVGHGSSVSAGVGEDRPARGVSRGCGRRRAGSRHRNGGWTRAEGAGEVDHTGRGGCAFWVAGAFRGTRYSILERANAPAARVESDRAGIDYRSGEYAVFMTRCDRSVAPLPFP